MIKKFEVIFKRPYFSIAITILLAVIIFVLFNWSKIAKLVF